MFISFNLVQICQKHPEPPILFVILPFFMIKVPPSQEPKHKVRDYGSSHKRKGIESDEESPPRKVATHRRMAVVYDSDDE